MNYIDISFPLNDAIAIYPNNPSYSINRVSTITDDKGSNVSEVKLGTHTGTHIDAPLHFVENGMSVDEIPLERINGRAKVVTITDQMEISINELKKREIEKDDIIIFKTSNSDVYRGEVILQNYVTLNYEAAEYLVDRGVSAVGIDYLTIERPRELRAEGKSIHKILLDKSIFIIEGLDLRMVQEEIYELFCFPLKLMYADGCPVRVVLSKKVDY